MLYVGTLVCQFADCHVVTSVVRWFATLRIVILEPVLSVGWFASGGASDIVTHACSVAVSQRVFPNQQSVLLLRTYIEKHWQQI